MRGHRRRARTQHETSGTGYSLSGHDNKSWYWEDYDGVPKCASCGLVNDPLWINPDFELNRKDMDLSFTHDGQKIVSDRFVTASAGQPGITFIPLPNHPGHHLVDVDRTVAFDIEARGTTLSRRCPTCGRFTHIAGATPVHLRPGVTLQPGFSRTDIEFGSSRLNPNLPYQQHPLILVDPDLGHHLASARLKGLVLKPIKDPLE